MDKEDSQPVMQSAVIIMNVNWFSQCLCHVFVVH